MSAMWTVARNARDANASKHDPAYSGARSLRVVWDGPEWQWIDTLMLRTGCL